MIKGRLKHSAPRTCKEEAPLHPLDAIIEADRPFMEQVTLNNDDDDSNEITPMVQPKRRPSMTELLTERKDMSSLVIKSLEEAPQGDSDGGGFKKSKSLHAVKELLAKENSRYKDDNSNSVKLPMKKSHSHHGICDLNEMSEILCV